MNAYHRTIHGGESVSTGEDDDMGNQLVGGDLHETHNHYQKDSGSKLLKAAGIAALLAGTGGVGFAIPTVLDALEKDKPKVETPIIETPNVEPSIGIIKLGEPDEN